MSDIDERVEDARLLWTAGRREGAFLLALVAVAAASRLERPAGGDRDAFEQFLRARFPWRISLEYDGALMALETVFYKLFRCQLVHEAGLPTDVAFLDDVPEDELVVRADGAPGFVLKVSPGWFHKLLECAQTSGLGGSA